MGKSSIPPPVGEVVLVQKKPEPVAEPKIREISHKEYEKLRPKKELSEKQKENLAKLVERNKQRAIERRAVVKDVVPETVPEDKELVVVKPKRKYVRKAKGGVVDSEPKNVVVQPESEPETATESEVEEKPRKRTTKPKKNTRVTPKKPTKYKYESETTSQDEWSDGDDSDDDYEEHKVQKYRAKAQARLKAVQEIDQRMSQIQNPYASRGLSVF